MIDFEDRQCLSRDIDAAQVAGARLHLARQIAGIDVRTLQHWKAKQGLVKGDGRLLAMRRYRAHALSPAERAALLCVASNPRLADVPPARRITFWWSPGGRIARVGGSMRCQVAARGERQEMADLRRSARRIARSKPAGQILILNVSKAASISPTGAPALGHQRVFLTGRFRVARPQR